MLKQTLTPSDQVTICQPIGCISKFTFSGVCPTLSYRYQNLNDIAIGTGSAGSVCWEMINDDFAWMPEDIPENAILGISSSPWNNAYLSKSPIITSNGSKKIYKLFDLLNPVHTNLKIIKVAELI